MGVKWKKLAQGVLRDAVLLCFGGWVVYREVYSVTPNNFLILVGFALMVPSARVAVLSVLSGLSESSSSDHSSSTPESQPHSKEDTGEREKSPGP